MIDRDELFSRVSRPVLCEPVNNDIVELRFRTANGPERVAPGRVAQMLATLVSRGSRGVTSAEFHAGVRVSDSIHKLRHRHGLVIETDRVGHGGVFAGEHAIYRLASLVEIIELVRADARRKPKRKSDGEAHHAS
jgi:hypothetical protein